VAGRPFTTARGKNAHVRVQHSSYRVSWRSKPWCGMPTATRPMPDQESSQPRSAQRARS
jgi:hypothetical protein